MTEYKEDDKFAQLLSLMHGEDLIRFRRRSEKRGFVKMAEFLTQEIKEREQREEQEHAKKK